jgi:glycolate oxidase FAD binding subunit
LNVTTAVDSIQTELAALVGESCVVSDPAECSRYAVDGKVPERIVYPSSAQQVAAVLKCAADHGLAVIPCRNGTKLGIGNPPRLYDVALSLKEMNRVWHYEPDDLTVSVEAGMKLGDFQHFVGRRGLWLPLDPAGGSRASIGGILATNSTGPLRLRYGAPRDMVLGMKIATPEGKVVKAGGRVVKNVAGYDLVRLLTGSYGTLGVIVEASFKLFPLPPERATFVFATRMLETARNLRQRILHSPLEPLRMILLDAKASMLARANTPLAVEVGEPEMWVEVGGSTRVIERYAREFERLGLESDTPVFRLDPEPAQLGWTRIADFRAWLVQDHADLIILRATLPIAASEEFLGRAQQDAKEVGMNLATFSQTGVGVLQLCLLGADQSPAVPAVIRKLRCVAEALGGALVMETCPADLKACLDVWGPPGNDSEVMRKLKLAFDPKGILAPGRFVGGL